MTSQCIVSVPITDMSGQERYKLDNNGVMTLLSSGLTVQLCLGKVLSDRSHQGLKFQAFVGYFPCG